MTVGKLREMANVTSEGATLESLARVGESLGFATRGFAARTIRSRVRLALRRPLGGVPLHRRLRDVEAPRVDRGPGAGFKKVSAEEFERGWTGKCLLFTPTTSSSGRAAVAVDSFPGVPQAVPDPGDLLSATLIVELLGVAPPIIVQNILDRVVVHQNVSLLHLLLGGSSSR